MAVVQLSDELQSVIERQVAEGRAVSPAAFLEDAVRRMVEATRREEEELLQVAQAGMADIEAGRFTTVASAEDERRLYDGVTARLRARLSDGG